MNHSLIITLIAYKLVLILIGIWASRRTRDTEDFFLGGRQLGATVAALSYCASSSSAWTLLGMSGLAFSIGLSAVWIALGAIAGAVFAWLWVAPRLMARSRTTDTFTLTEFLAHGATSVYGTRIRQAATVVIVFSFAFYIAAQFQAAGSTFVATLDTDLTTSIVAGGVIIIAYTLLGGFLAVSVTDAVQGAMMVLTTLVLPVLAWASAGGWPGIQTSFAAADLETLLSPSGRHTGLIGLGVILGGMSVGLGAIGQPHLVARFMALKDRQALNHARWIAILWFAIVFLGMCALGITARALFPAFAAPESVFFHMTTELFPPVMAGAMIAAVLAAIMSTADSMLLVSAASIAHDLGLAKRYPGRELLLARATMVTLSVAAIVLAIQLPSSIFNRALFAWVAIGSAFGPALVFRLAGVDVTPAGVLRAMLGGFTLAVVLYYLPNTPGDIAERVAPFTLGVIVLWLHRERVASRSQAASV